MMRLYFTCFVMRLYLQFNLIRVHALSQNQVVANPDLIFQGELCWIQ